MSETKGFHCRSCGHWHDSLPHAYCWEAPALWDAVTADHEESVLGEEQCIIQGKHFFVRGRIATAVVDDPEDFEWGVRVSLSEENFDRMHELWQSPERAQEPYFGWLIADIPDYEPDTMYLETNVLTQAPGIRPLVELQAGDHPLAVEQRRGITTARVQEIAELLLHQDED